MPCPAGSHAANVQNTPANFTYNIYQPRVAGTYTSNPNDVFRFSYGRYTEAPNTAFEQYNTRQEDLADYIGSHFLQFGRNSPGYPILPPTSDQLRPLVGASCKEHRLVVQAHAVLAADPRSDPAVLPDPAKRLRLRLERRQPAQRRRRVPVAKGRLLARRPVRFALVRVHELLRTLWTDRSRCVGIDGSRADQQLDR